MDAEDHLAFAAIDWGSGVWVGDFGLYEGYYSPPNSMFGYVYTDRPVYRPGQEVFFKGIVRANDDLPYSLPEVKKVYVTIELYGEKILADYLH